MLGTDTIIPQLNLGERGEIASIKYMFHVNELGEYDTLVNIFGNCASDGIRLIDAKSNEIVTDDTKISKTSAHYKADITIKMIKTAEIFNVSIKSTSGGNYAILNHTSRGANVFSDKLLKHLPQLDILVAEYIKKT
jgi:hypothetical protein